jgi:hypothetical protein
MKTHHAPTVRGYPRVFQQLEGGAATASRERLLCLGGAPWWILCHPRRPVGP